MAQLLRATGKPYRHIALGPTRKGGNAQRNALLRLIRHEHLEGIVYNMDDDNAYHPSLWAELRRLRPMRVGAFAVRRGSYPPPSCDGVFDVLRAESGWKFREHMIERATYEPQTGFTGRGWLVRSCAWNWQKLGPRTFCVDMGGFAFDAALLRHMDEPLWNYTGHGGETEFISRLLPGGVAEDLQPLANCGQDVLVFHNEYRTLPVAIRRPRTLCGLDGWGIADDELRRAELEARPSTRPWSAPTRPSSRSIRASTAEVAARPALVVEPRAEGAGHLLRRYDDGDGWSRDAILLEGVASSCVHARMAIRIPAVGPDRLAEIAQEDAVPHVPVHQVQGPCLVSTV